MEFQNITRNEYEEDYINKMEVRGFIANVTGKTVNIPTMQIELLDKNCRRCRSSIKEPPVPRIVGGGGSRFELS